MFSVKLYVFIGARWGWRGGGGRAGRIERGIGAGVVVEIKVEAEV